MFKRIFLFISILFLLIFWAIIHAEPSDLEVKSSVSKNKVTTDETFNLLISISGSIKGSPEIELPKLENDFVVLSTGQSQRFAITGRESITTLIYEYVLKPKAQGKFTIGEIIIKLEGSNFSTQPIEIEVTAPEKKELLPEDIEKKLEKGEEVTI